MGKCYNGCRLAESYDAEDGSYECARTHFCKYRKSAGHNKQSKKE